MSNANNRITVRYLGVAYENAGGIRNHGTLTASGCTFTGGIIGAEGDAIFSDGTLTLSSCGVSGGYAQGGATRGGGILELGHGDINEHDHLQQRGPAERVAVLPLVQPRRRHL